ncbi:MAG: zinc ribbon domain-containing protein [Euryarchaeota archaeon]|nr:zinc ribbon domain-containing protein [Euryarchaeota archaeon]MDE1836290.1 zinc ribbon domain-containing protein [Euryarchaeota archaeon]MDE1879088.1 zinc ribbon domain-containing protein [Euryarchaeota archaeon]MDE2044314.1 zinc ribbon domain-containing protein [Thermoplasmata archaeon]
MRLVAHPGVNDDRSDFLPLGTEKSVGDLQGEFSRGEDVLVGMYQARRGDLQGHAVFQPGLLIVTARGCCFARRKVLILGKDPNATYFIDPESEVDFVRDYYLTSGLLDLREEPNGLRAVCVGSFSYYVDDPSTVFQQVYRAKENALARIAPILPRGGGHSMTGHDGPVTVVREVVREIVRIPCKYCGSLVDVTAKACPQCGAPFHL